VLLFTVGRHGATATLNLPAAGLTADNRGRLKVNEFFQTEIPTIYAAGDVIGFPALAATSMSRPNSPPSTCSATRVDGATPLFPFGIYTIPEISMVGETEQSLTQKGQPYEVGMSRYREDCPASCWPIRTACSSCSFTPRAAACWRTHHRHRRDRINSHRADGHAAGMSIDYFIEAVFNYPTLAECYKVAALDGFNRARAMGATGAAAPAPASKSGLIPPRAS